MEYGSNFIGLFALSSAICCHLVSKAHFAVTKSWITGLECYEGWQHVRLLNGPNYQR
jgi:hypothetical protein